MELKSQIDEIKNTIGGIVGFCSGNVILKAAMMTLPAGKIGLIAKAATAIGAAGLAGLAGNKVTEYVCDLIDEKVQIEIDEATDQNGDAVEVEVINT